ncbi:MAG TPA: sugar ABC transporter permease [candidate division Zixibacteria bacterium]|nr:sugar ABC transporter permease [candidate division Zixibacteria bacterium]
MAGKRAGFLLPLPWTLTLLFIWVFPLIWSLVLAFADYNLLSGELKWIGFENFKKLLGDPGFQRALWNTFLFVIGTLPFTTLFALLLAMALNRPVWGKNFFKASFFVPTITSLVVVALIFTQLYSEGSWLYRFLGRLFNLPSGGFLLSEKTALPSIMIMDIWAAIGYYILLFLVALQNVPQELYEAARVEGANNWQTFWAVTFPSIKPMLFFIVTLNTIKSFQVFTEVFVMTKGGPLGSTITAVYFIYEEGLFRFKMGYASAAAYLLFGIIALFSYFLFKSFKSESEVLTPAQTKA